MQQLIRSENKSGRLDDQQLEQFSKDNALTMDEIRQIMEAFNLFDTNNNGSIDVEELKIGIQQLQHDAQHLAINSFLQNLIQELDIEESIQSQVNFKEFLRKVIQFFDSQNSEEDLKMIFDLFDKGNKEKITKDDLIALSKDCLLYTSDAADDMQCVDLGGRRILKKKKYQSRRISLLEFTQQNSICVAKLVQQVATPIYAPRVER
eukprot:TRINITY_DN13668_c0_g1_i1.p1 TRINITY_DN13668_c0_g1~~TRINITY_DN13668_c0_g1_i1.p1  ORF type:complete len:206 (-),score=34.99 TRINITY_DN13668_c0_g1_i1:13-630(-)